MTAPSIPIKFTLANVRAALRPRGLSIRSTGFGDYRVAFAGRGNEASAYYTTDLEDAFYTGIAMERTKNAQA